MKFQCSCGQTLRADASLVGEQIPCPKCQASVLVPDPAELAAELEEKQRQKERRKQQRKKKEAAPSGVATLFYSFGDWLAEVWELSGPLLIHYGGFIFGPLLLLIFAAFYLAPGSITADRVKQIQPGMTLQQVEAILGGRHTRYRDPHDKEVFVFNVRELFDYSDAHPEGTEPNARHWHDGWFVTGNNQTRSVYVAFEGDTVSNVLWREFDGKKLTTHYPLAGPGSVNSITRNGTEVVFGFNE